MQLSSYFDRIGYKGEAGRDLETLTALHAAHLEAIPFENLDVQFYTPVSLNPEEIYDKIVNRKRGGWCYEMNTLFEWVLREIGFNVTRQMAGVMRDTKGDEMMGNHLCLIVTLDQDYLVDVGFGGSQSRPLPLKAGKYEDGPFTLILSDAGDGYWRFTEESANGALSFDFRPGVHDESLIAAKCEWQQKNPSSIFRQRLTAQRRRRDWHIALRGNSLTRVTKGRHDHRKIMWEEDLVDSLYDWFGLDLPEAKWLWPKVHEQAQGEKQE